MTLFDNNTMLDKEATSILSISTPIKKSYESVIKRYELLATENKWLNKDKTVWPIAKESPINLARRTSTEQLGDEIKIPILNALSFESTKSITFAIIQL
ncbi:20998_t:CDS:2, partial [Racocetra persica]